jgi:hypothetical protein
LTRTDIKDEINESVKLTLCTWQTVFIHDPDGVIQIVSEQDVGYRTRYDLVWPNTACVSITNGPDPSSILVSSEPTPF